MFADGDLVPEDGPDNHVTAENGDMGNWDVYIGGMILSNAFTYLCTKTHQLCRM